jgi:hypothetical protein
MTLEEFPAKEWYTIRITGNASSPHHRFENFLAMVSTISPAQEDIGPAVKVWPMNDDDERRVARETGDESGKYWFLLKDVESVEVVCADEWE